MRNESVPLTKSIYQQYNNIVSIRIDDVVNQFVNAASKRDVIIVHPIADGKIHRCHVAGKSTNNTDGAYILHSDGIPAGGFQNHTDGLGWQNWRVDIDLKLTQAEKISLRTMYQEFKRLREIEQHQKHEKIAAKARYLLECSKAAKSQKAHPYLIKKGIQPHGAWLLGKLLVIPIYDPSCRLVNLQFISPVGKKRFLSGGRKKGSFHIIGEPSGRILICEGFATDASLFEDCGQRVVVAFDAGNLLPVAKNIRALAPDTEIILCGDNDLSGVGQKAARDAALAIKGKILIPPTAGFDWNDYLAIGGDHA
ncbi:toprim domain-containing protein [Nitrosomonas communis]|uniref:Putative DNA primase/helicase n=1 Tax=Nitrosomonas communis TaxID=44574 RepID=A0A1I4V388_9PROT|nr:toprim domain-containing protein [Nitrosomonas communis]SFM95707.1 putative DNA primase/helicase [Nitrosomonas communis]